MIRHTIQEMKSAEHNTNCSPFKKGNIIKQFKEKHPDDQLTKFMNLLCN